jgi:hypothetical protein
MLFDLTSPCYLTTFSGKMCLSGKLICAFFVPLIEVLLYRKSPQSDGLVWIRRMSDLRTANRTIPNAQTSKNKLIDHGTRILIFGDGE